ncbi:hypothetical protein AB0F15_40700 [Amycolatopsis sp. NPDC026612]|uniref:hypothetical protein n=1 Tax=Amycolatopsis sp. NPDC026612 TaxID=3155466 RepID=UPI0033FF520C
MSWSRVLGNRVGLAGQGTGRGRVRDPSTGDEPAFVDGAAGGRPAVLSTGCR